jgi:hypothetical protein
MQEKNKSINVDDILRDERARKQLMDLLLDQAEDECEIKLNGKTYKVSLDVNLTPSF